VSGGGGREGKEGEAGVGRLRRGRRGLSQQGGALSTGPHTHTRAMQMQAHKSLKSTPETQGERMWRAEGALTELIAVDKHRCVRRRVLSCNLHSRLVRFPMSPRL
jgi:hypothetical protein